MNAYIGHGKRVKCAVCGYEDTEQGMKEHISASWDGCPDKRFWHALKPLGDDKKARR